MVSKVKLFKNIRIASVVTLIAIIASAFALEISLVQAVVFNPILLLAAISVYGYADFQLDILNETADIHQLPAPKSILKCRLFDDQKDNGSNRAA